MKSSLVLCALLGVFFSVKAASVNPSVEGVTLQPATDTSTLLNASLPPPVTCCKITSPSAISLGPDSSSPNQVMCPDGWVLLQGRCYYFVNEFMTWPQAQTKCALLDSMLASVHSPQEYGALQQLTNSNGNQVAWLGGFYLQEQWLWIDGSWFYNNNWSGQSPDSSNPCLLLNFNEAWTNSQCDASSFASICVKNANAPQGMMCPEGWTGFQGRCYHLNDGSLTWAEADTNCAELQASLVSVHSPQEYYFLYQQTSVNGFSPTWLGGFYLEDQWLWLDGSWFYPGYFTEMSPDSTNPCLSTCGPDGWCNYNCDQAFPSFCVRDAF